MAKLTEQDILNWNGPESDYMNEDQLAFFRETLVKMQDELIAKASVTTDHLQDHEAAPDPADRASQEEEYALELRTRDRERKLLVKIQASIRAIDEGEYLIGRSAGAARAHEKTVCRLSKAPTR